MIMTMTMTCCIQNGAKREPGGGEIFGFITARYTHKHMIKNPHAFVREHDEPIIFKSGKGQIVEEGVSEPLDLC
jgi:hypothetical protein